MNIFIENAWAQSGESGGDPLLGFLPLIIIFVVFHRISLKKGLYSMRYVLITLLDHIM